MEDQGQVPFEVMQHNLREGAARNVVVYTEPEMGVIEAEVDPLLERLNRMEEVQHRFLDMVDGMSRAISLLADEIAQQRADQLDRLKTLREIVEAHSHGPINGEVLVGAYMAKENTRRG